MKTQHASIRNTFFALALLASSAADAQGLTKMTGFLTTLKGVLTTVVPIIAVIAGLGIVIAYWFRMVQKETFFTWIIGLIIAGSVSEIVALFV